jgi:sn-glycerol 3-phosphate transport system permease protein
MLTKRVTFGGRVLPMLLVAPQLAITLVFFVWPASQAIYQSVMQEDPFGLKREFVGLANFERVFANEAYLESFGITAAFSLAVTAIALAVALLFAAMADWLIRGARAYTTLLIWPYAVAPAIAGVLWWFLLNPTIGIYAHALSRLGLDWNPRLNGTHAFVLIVVAAAWKQVSYNFVFFLAALQSIPRSLIEAAAIDGAGPGRRFRTIILPLIGPTTFFLLVVNVVYAFFDTFGIVHATTGGGPGTATTILVYKVFKDGFESLDLGGSAVQSVVLMAVVMALTLVQFRFVERKIHY